MIYFIQQGNLLNKKVKIGYSSNPQERLYGLQASTPNKLKFLLVLFGDFSTEVYYHDLFAKYHIQGEWFQYGMKLRLFIWLHSNGLDLTDKKSKKSVPIQKASSPIENTAQQELSKANLLSQLDTINVGKRTKKNQKLGTLKQLQLDNPDMGASELAKALGVSRQTIYNYQDEISLSNGHPPNETNGVA